MNEKHWKIAAVSMAVVLILLLGIGIGALLIHHKNAGSTPKSVSYVKLSINLKNGQLVSPADTYVVQPGVGLQFSIYSNVFGKIGVPTNPPQTITFTQSPVVFKFNVTKAAGSYQLTYEARGSTTVIPIGTIDVK